MRSRNIQQKMASSQAKIFSRMLGKKKKQLENVIESAPVQAPIEVAVVVPVVEPAPVIAAPVVQKAPLPSLEELQDVILSDVVSFEMLLNNPVITPAGVTYNRASLEGLDRDPITREPLDKSALFPNLLAADLAAYYSNDHVDLTQAAPGLICPETGQLYQHPVVAANGKTYEEAWIVTYHHEHGGKLPTGEEELSLRLYPNLLVTALTGALKDHLKPIQLNAEEKEEKKPGI